MAETLLYENALTRNTGEWVMEGGGVAEWTEECLVLRPTRFTPVRSNVETDHFTMWLNKDFPSDVAIEWEFRYPPKEQNPDGLAIIFFAARGLSGEDVLDPKLQPRNGIFERYCLGDINCLHTSYIAIGRQTANLRKNKGFFLPASGPDLSSLAGPNAWHQIRVMKKRATIELRLNGEVSYAWEDDGKQYGTRLGGGKIAFRQQNNLLRGDYRNLKVLGL